MSTNDQYQRVSTEPTKRQVGALLEDIVKEGGIHAGRAEQMREDLFKPTETIHVYVDNFYVNKTKADDAKGNYVITAWGKSYDTDKPRQLTLFADKADNFLEMVKGEGVKPTLDGQANELKEPIFMKAHGFIQQEMYDGKNRVSLQVQDVEVVPAPAKKNTHKPG